MSMCTRKTMSQVDTDSSGEVLSLSMYAVCARNKMFQVYTDSSSEVSSLSMCAVCTRNTVSSFMVELTGI